MHEPGRIYKVFVWKTEEFLFETHDLHRIIRTARDRKERLLCLSPDWRWEVWPGGRNVLARRAELPPGPQEIAIRLYTRVYLKGGRIDD